MSWPVAFMNIEVTNICNEVCKHCGNPSLRYPKGYMGIRQFKQVCDNIIKWNKATKIEFCGYGEPFCNKNIYDMMEYLVEYNIKYSIVTNGTIAFRSDRIEMILMAEKIRISLDGVSDDVYNLTRPKGKVSDVLGNINKLIESRHASCSSNLKCIVRMNVFKSNYHQMHDLIRLCQSMGVDHVQIVRGAAPADMQVQLDPDDFCMYPPGFLLDALVRNQDVSHSEAGTDQLNSAADIFRYLQCPCTTVRWDGTVNPCCFDQNCTIVLGNLLMESADGIFSMESLGRAGQYILNKYDDSERVIACHNCGRFRSLRNQLPIS